MRSSEDHYWKKYLETLPASKRPVDPYVEASFAGSRDATDGLLQLYLSGKKIAGSSVLEDFISAGDPLPKVGNYWILLNSLEEPSCILRTEGVVFNKFKDVPLEIAIAEGEGDLSLNYWKRVHEGLYKPHLKEWGLSRIDDATVITEYFKIVHKYGMRPTNQTAYPQSFWTGRSAGLSFNISASNCSGDL